MRKNKFKEIKQKDLTGKYELNIDIKNSEPACFICLPPAPLKGHLNLYGVTMHQRIDCPDGKLYMVNEDSFKERDSK